MILAAEGAPAPLAAQSAFANVSAIMTSRRTSPLASKVASWDAQCRAWHKKALSGEAVTKKEEEQFAETEAIQDTLYAHQACRDFFALQRKCQTYIHSSFEFEATYEGDPRNKDKEVAKVLSAMINAMRSVPGCKTIIGMPLACEEVKTASKAVAKLVPQHRAFLEQCLSAGIVTGSWSFIRVVL